MDALATVEEFELYLRQTVATEPASLALAGASGLIRSYCRWPISAADETFTVDGSGTTVLNLPTLRLNDVTEVRVDGEVLAADTYAWGVAGQLVRYDGYWPARLRAVEVDVSHGYDPAPDDVKVVTMAVAARHYINPEGLRSKVVGGVSQTFVLETMSGELTELERVLVAGYRLP